jgi:hypothetical protein
MNPRKLRSALVFMGAFLTVSPLAAQLIIGQYENEAPFRTWNSFPFAGASALGRGETVLTLAADASAGLSNPALLVRLPRLTVTINGFFQYATAFRYAYINTGVLTTSEPVGRSLAGLDLAAVAYRFGDWAVSAAAADFEFYHRPAVRAESSTNGQIDYSNDFDQTGTLRGAAFSLARRLGGRLSVGLTVIVFQGDFLRTSVENVVLSGYTISDTISRKFSGVALQGGIAWEPWNGFTLAVTVRGPWTKKADSSSALRYQAPSGPTDISIADSSQDVLRQPWIAGLGLSIRPLEGLTLAADAVYYGWSQYAPEYFGEVQERNFRDIVRIGTGAEYSTRIRLFGRDVDYPNRIGVVYDPQPMASPRSSYVYLTFGTGLHWPVFHIDLGVSLGGESGSGHSLVGRRIALTLSFLLGERP